MTKVLCPNTDRWINESEQWYNWQTALKLIQGCGRSIRSEDWAKQYVLDPGTFVMKSNNTYMLVYSSSAGWEASCV